MNRNNNTEKPTGVDELADVFGRINDCEMMRHFFNEIFTDSELATMALRWQALKMVHQKVPQRKISQELGISLCKITRAAKIIKSEDSVSRKIIEETERDN